MTKTIKINPWSSAAKSEGQKLSKAKGKAKLNKSIPVNLVNE